MKKLILLFFLTLPALGQTYLVSNKTDSTVIFVGDSVCSHDWVYGERLYGATYAIYPPIYTYTQDRICQKCLRRESFSYEERQMYKKTLFDSLEELVNKKIPPKIKIPYNITPTTDTANLIGCLHYDTCYAFSYIAGYDSIHRNTEADTVYYDYIGYIEGWLEYGFTSELKICAGLVITQNSEIVCCELPNGEIIYPDNIIFLASKRKPLGKHDLLQR